MKTYLENMIDGYENQLKSVIEMNEHYYEKMNYAKCNALCSLRILLEDILNSLKKLNEETRTEGNSS